MDITFKATSGTLHNLVWLADNYVWLDDVAVEISIRVYSDLMRQVDSGRQIIIRDGDTERILTPSELRHGFK